jgi:hypothetical protein
MHSKTVKLLLSLAAILFFLPSGPLLANDDPPPLVEVWILSPKEGSGSEFYKALGEHMAFRSENGDPRAWQSYTPVLGDDLSRVAIRHCCFNWSDQDAYDEWSNSAEAISKHFNENVGPHVGSAEHYFESTDWNNSHWNADGGPYRYFAATEFKLKAGKAGQFDAARDKISQIALNQGWATADHSWVWLSRIGGTPQESIVIPHANYASMQPEEESFMQFLSKRMGSPEAARQLMQEFSESTWSSDFQIWEHSKSLSMPDDG